MFISQRNRLQRIALAVAVAAVWSHGSALGQRPSQEVSVLQFHEGDRILVHVDSEPQLSDTFTVVFGPAVTLPIIGQLSLSGVTHQSLEPYLTREIGRYIRSPIVHAHPLVRIGVFGEVVRASYYLVNADATLSDAIMAAGGVTGTAQIASAFITRNDSTVWPADSVRGALATGVSMDRFGVRSGDQIVVPRAPDHAGDVTRFIQIFGVLLTIPALLLAIKRGGY
jgi:protein involved in polysaccharide export with SLBB domain